MNKHLIALVFLLGAVCFVPAAEEASDSRGEQIYRDLCAHCHGPGGEGVAGKYDGALYGERSVESLARLIHRTMPEDDPSKCRDQDAEAVAGYIYGAFYSPAARAKSQPPRVALSRLTNRQFRESVTDLVATFTPGQQASKTGGLKADYFQSDGMNKKAKKAFSRLEATLDFDFGTNSPGEGITADQFSIAWQGSLLAPDTGFYEMRLSTPNGARLYVNSDLKEGDSNSRDDSDARRHSAALDLWVSSGGQRREATVRLFLLGGRSYPLRLDFFKYKDTNAAVRLEWKPPHGVWSVLGGQYLSPEGSRPLAVVTTPFPADDRSMGYERGTAVSSEWQQATTRAALEAANQVLARLTSLSGVRENATNRHERLAQFAGTFAERAFRRPLTEDLRQEYVAEHFEAVENSELALKRALLMILTSPRFLYPELADGNHYAIAARLGLVLWDSLPDKPLLEAAKRGELNPEQVRSHAKRMLQDPRAKAKLREFFHHWLLMEEGADLAKDAKTYPGFDEALIADLRESLDLFTQHVLWSEGSDFRELLLSETLFLNARLAKFYGTELSSTNQFEPVTIPGGQRAGIFTHPYLMATLSYHKSTSPIHRGVFLTRNVLGRFLKPPPMAISFMDDRFDPSLTMREKVTELTKSDTCMACHVTINPLGFSLEHYDAVGRWRTLDNNKPVNAESDYLTPDGEVLRLKGARDVARHAAASEEARLGFIRQMFHYTAKQTPAAYGADTLALLDQRFQESHYHMRDLFVEIAARVATHPFQAQTQAKR